MVNNNRLDTSASSAIEASASSSTGSSLFADSKLDLVSDGKEDESPADLSLTSQSQYAEDKEMLYTKKDQQSG